MGKIERYCHTRCHCSRGAKRTSKEVTSDGSASESDGENPKPKTASATKTKKVGKATKGVKKAKKEKEIQKISGIKIVDVSNGIGPLGTSIALKSELEYTKRELAQLVTVPVSENQLLGLTSFATHIGLGNFAKSELLVELNDGNYADVPMYMKRWRVGMKKWKDNMGVIYK